MAFQKAYNPCVDTRLEENRVKRCKDLLTRLADEEHREVIFFDEKQFGQELPYAPQNYRVYARRFQDLPKNLKKFLVPPIR